MALMTACSSLAILPVSAFAQSSGSVFGDKPFGPSVSQSYLGLSVGKVKFDPDCLPGFGCDRGNTGFKLTAGAMSTDVLGAEFSYVDLGKIDFSGGRQRARGVNLSLIGSLPLAVGFSAFGKVGATFGWTETSSSVPTVRTGDEKGFGISYGLGVGYRLTPQFEVIAEYERHRFDFAPGSQTLGFGSIGLRYKY